MLKIIKMAALTTTLITIYVGKTAQAAEDIMIKNPTFGVKNIEGFNRILTSFEFTSTLLIIILTIAALALEYRLVMHSGIDFTPDDVLKLIILTIIILGALMFVTAGFGSKQIAPAIGLFGTIAGYLLGKSVRKGRDENDENKHT